MILVLLSMCVIQQVLLSFLNIVKVIFMVFIVVKVCNSAVVLRQNTQEVQVVFLRAILILCILVKILSIKERGPW